MNRSQGPSFRTRRLVALSVTLVVIAIFWGITRWETSRLGMPAFFTGFTLLAGLFLLMLLGVRRRLPFWPLGSVRTWTQIHLYVGVFTTAIYLLHVPALIAGGVLEGCLSIIFLMVTASGFYGIYASRTLPKKLTAVESHRLGAESNRRRGRQGLPSTQRNIGQTGAGNVLPTSLVTVFC